MMTQYSKARIDKEMNKRLELYKGLDFLQSFAMYIGQAQILEIGLKKVLSDEFGLTLGKIEKWTLGRTLNELKSKGLRSDLSQLLDGVLQDRNFIVHELLAGDIFLNSIIARKNKKLRSTKYWRILMRSIYQLEQVLLLCGWAQQHNAWKAFDDN